MFQTVLIMKSIVKCSLAASAIVIRDGEEDSR